ncbi:deoxyuridine 5'-triphosphate nucleotidohydrolase-like [Equus quagga]|uniref:deoxyuridine 5'-triphosphate nucleotidohydrolase-like n=1 Tax=Equus quagga TaxID=89248 RepID=UPI001EE19EB1|nr:deoxyuridine 5'-triphosphate nucleotidohydrolase-like [Equus quagga]
MEVAPFTITPRDPLAKFLLPVLATLCYSGLLVSVPEEGMLPLGDTAMIPLKGKLRLPHGYFGLLMPLNQQARKRVTVLAGVIDLDYQAEIGLLLPNGSKEEYVWNTGEPLGHLLILPYTAIKVSGKLKQPNPGRISNDLTLRNEGLGHPTE